MNGMAICAGLGGLELGISLAYGPDYRTVVFIEREAFSAAALVARMEEASLGMAPIWDDLTTFDGGPWCGVVDLISAGFPCQPWSYAGRRETTDDERWIWDDIARIIREVGPEWVFLENVPGLIHGGIEHVLRDLAIGGFDAEWDCFTAAQVGAPHIRERLFILAHARRQCIDRLQPVRLSGGSGAASTSGTGSTMGNPERQGLALGAGVGSHDGAELAAAQRASRPLADAIRGRCDGRASEPQQGAVERTAVQGASSRALFPPGPADLSAWREVQPGFEPALCSLADGLSGRLDELHALGNGVVPIVAATAFRSLYARLNDD